MAVLDAEIQTYDQILESLEADHMGEWVVIHGDKLIGTYQSFDDAACDAVQKFGNGP